MKEIISRDGTRIAYRRSGTGPPLILVHGAAGDGTRWAPIVPALEPRFSVVVMDRRGRGGGREDYAVKRESEDIAAVVDGIGEPAFLLGHSFGGLCALEAALLTPNVRKLVLYESLMMPPPGVPLVPERVIDGLQALVDAGDREGMLTTFMGDVAGMSPDEIEMAKSSPAWPARVAGAHTVPRELRAGSAYRFDAGRFKDLRTPALLLLGGDSPDLAKAGTAALDAGLPDSRVVVIPGVQHVATYTKPELFVQVVSAFLIGPDGTPPAG